MKGFQLLPMLLIILFPIAVFARPSLDVQDTIDELVVTIDGIEESFTVIRDADRKNQWHYMPAGPQLYERTVGNEKRPEFILVRYQQRDPANPEQFIEAGLVQFSARLALPPAALNQLKGALAQRIDQPVEQISLAALRMLEASVTVFDDNGKLIGEEFTNTGLAPTFATQKMAFHIPLTVLGADVYDAMVNGTTGVMVSVQFKYEGLSPRLGVRCEVDYYNAYKLYTKDQKFAASASFLGYFNAKSDKNKTKIREILEKEKVIKCEGVGGKGFDADKMMTVLLAQINKEIVDTLVSPKELKLPEAGKPKTGKGLKQKLTGIGVSGGYSVKIKDEQRIQKGKQTFDMSVRHVQTLESIASGFIGIGRYPKNIRDELVVEVAAGNWAKAYFVLPPVGEETGLTRVDFSVKLNTPIPQQQTAIWQPVKGWTNPRNGGKPANALAFGLLGLSKSEIKQMSFEENFQLTRGGDVLRVQSTRDVVNGDVPVATPLEAVSVVVVDATNLTFRQIDGGSSLTNVTVKLQSDGRSFSESLRPKKIDRTSTEPDPLIWIVPRNASVVPTISFRRRGAAELKQWSGNGKAVLLDSAKHEFFLDDDDWQ